MVNRVSAVLLAAGLSRRMGQPKQLLPLGTKRVVNHCVDNISAADIQDIVVVIGPHDDKTAAALAGRSARIVVNPAPGSDMAGSARIGLQALDQSCSGVLVCLVDHPLASGDTMNALARAHSESPDKIIIPSHNGRRGHPSLFPTSILNELFVMDTLRDIVRKDEGRVQVVEVADDGVVLDMDTPEDYERALKRAGVA